MKLDMYTIMLIAMIIGSLLSVMARSLIRAAVALAFTSAVLAVIMFQLDSPLAAVFELSVCSGLITVLFISTISMTMPMTSEESRHHMQHRLRKFGILPLIVIILGIALCYVVVNPEVQIAAQQTGQDVRQILWNTRGLDVLGQIIILLAGVFGVIILFKEPNKK